MNGDSPVRRRLLDNWIAIVLTVAAIIQGLALGRLAGTMDKVHSFSGWCAFALAFVIVLRVFQTYVAAAIEYNEWRVNFVDLAVIFGLGLVQYELIGKLEAANFRPQAFETWVAVITGVAVLAHLRAHWNVAREPAKAGRDVVREQALQRVNTAVAGICLVLAIIVIMLNVNGPMFAALVLTQLALVVINIHHSVRVTIDRPLERVREGILRESSEERRKE